MSVVDPTPPVLVLRLRDRTGARRWWSAFSALHRLNHAATYLPTFMWGILVVAPSVSMLWSPWLMAGLAINALTVFGGFVLNTITDVRSDLRNENKIYMLKALRTIGVKRAVWMYLFEQFVALLLSIVASFKLNQPLVFVVTLFAVFSNWAYSAPPLRMKSKSLMGPLFMGMKSGLFPGLIAMSTVPDARFAIETGALLVGLTLSTASRGVWHSIPDFSADRASGIRTVAVKHGIIRAVRVAVLATVVGCVLNLTASTSLMGWWGVLACAGMVGTIYNRYRVGSLADESAIIEHMNDPKSEIINARWNRATYTMLCVAAFGNLIFIE